MAMIRVYEKCCGYLGVRRERRDGAGGART